MPSLLTLRCKILSWDVGLSINGPLNLGSHHTLVHPLSPSHWFSHKSMGKDFLFSAINKNHFIKVSVLEWQVLKRNFITVVVTSWKIWLLFSNRDQWKRGEQIFVPSYHHRKTGSESSSFPRVLLSLPPTHSPFHFGHLCSHVEKGHPGSEVAVIWWHVLCSSEDELHMWGSEDKGYCDRAGREVRLLCSAVRRAWKKIEGRKPGKLLWALKPGKTDKLLNKIKCNLVPFFLKRSPSLNR